MQYFIFKIIEFLQVEKLLIYVMKSKKRVKNGGIFDICFEIILQRFWKYEKLWNILLEIENQQEKWKEF